MLAGCLLVNPPRPKTTSLSVRVTEVALPRISSRVVWDIIMVLEVFAVANKVFVVAFAFAQSKSFVRERGTAIAFGLQQSRNETWRQARNEVLTSCICILC